MASGKYLMSALSDTETTIAAVASPPGVGAVALIRLSGSQALPIINKIWRGRPLDPPRLARYGCLVNDQGETLDSVLATYFRGPASYTGEDLIEITTHGGTLVTRRVLEALLSVGAVPAAPGEFSQRAFLHGKMDLTQAEAVMDLISAQTDLALRSAQEQLSGRLGEKIHSLRAGLLDLLAHIEAHIDFPDEDIDPDTEEALRRRHVDLQLEVEQLLGTAEQGRLLREGARVALIGPPNAGKSSLLNWLLGYERAIVSPTAGTTRDFLEERFNLRGMPVRLIDTAGLRGETADSIEQVGMARTRTIATEADVVIELHDASNPRPADFVFTPTASGHVLVLNKVDLGVDPSWQETPEALHISCLQSVGLETLLDRIFSHLTQGQTHWGTDPVAINARHQYCLQQAQLYLQASQALLEKKELPELMALELRSALDAVGDIVGRADTEELLGVIFSSFCIGK